MAWKFPVYNWLLSVCREAARAANYAVAESAKCFNDFAKDEANVARFNSAMSVVLPKVIAAMAKTTAGALASMTPLATAIATAAIETAYHAYKMTSKPPAVLTPIDPTGLESIVIAPEFEQAEPGDTQ